MVGIIAIITCQLRLKNICRKPRRLPLFHPMQYPPGRVPTERLAVGRCVPLAIQLVGEIHVGIHEVGPSGSVGGR